MNEEELKEKLEKLEKYEAQERTRARWQPHEELQARLSYMYDCKQRLEEASDHQAEADEISSEFDLGLVTWGSASICEVLEDLENQIEAKEKESLEMEIRLEEE
jgi:hypothetical protein